MPRALVTGGAGFAGSVLAEALERAGHDVRILDLHPMDDPPPSWEVVRGDVRDADAVARAVRGCHVVVDNAALVPVSRSTPDEFLSVNAQGARNVLSAARAEGAYALHISSSSIYGVPAELPVRETTPLRPFEPYGASKAAGERVVEEERARGLRVASLRTRAIVGAGRLGLFELVFRRIRGGRRVPLFGSGSATIQMCDAADFASAALAMVEQRADGAYNVGARVQGTVRDDLETLIARAGTGARLQPVPVWAIRTVLRPLDVVGRSPFTRWHWVASDTTFYADMSKAESELGWRPRHSTSEALWRAYEGWLSAPEGGGRSPHRRPLEGRFARMLRGQPPRDGGP